jgi:hypothetical protein
MILMKNRMLLSFGLSTLVLVIAGLSAKIPGTAFRTGSTQLDDFPNLQDFNSTLNADFDGDTKPDMVVGTAAGRGFVVQVKFSTQVPPASLSFAGMAPWMRILSRDVNNDNDEDLIVTSCASLIPVAVFLGDGKGHFQPGNPWNFIPFGLNSSVLYESPKDGEGAVPNTEERLRPDGALRGLLSQVQLNAEPLIVPGSRVSTFESTAFVCTPRAPPALRSL